MPTKIDIVRQIFETFGFGTTAPNESIYVLLNNAASVLDTKNYGCVYNQERHKGRVNRDVYPGPRDVITYILGPAVL